MGGGSKSSTSTQQTLGNSSTSNTVTPYAPAQNDINSMLDQARAAYGATPQTPIFSGANADQTYAVNFLRDQAQGTATGAEQLRSLGTDMAAGKYLDPNSNPYIKGVVQAALAPAQEQFGKNLVSIGDAATMAGAYGGDRMALQKVQSLQDLNTISANTAAQIYGQNYANERQLQMQAPQLLTAANQLTLNPANIYSKIGDQEQSWTMAQIAAQQQAPWTGLDNWAQILQQVQPYASQSGQNTFVQNSNGTSTGPQASGFQSAASGALGGASAGASFGPWGAAIGGVIGGLGGLFG